MAYCGRRALRLWKSLKVDTVLVKLVSLGTKKLSAVAKYVFYVIGAALVGGLGYLIFWLFSPPYPSNILSQIPAALTVTTMRVVAAVVIAVLLALPFVIRSVKNVAAAQNIYSLASILGSIPAVVFILQLWL